jgi:hypothetical protein
LLLFIGEEIRHAISISGSPPLGLPPSCWFDGADIGCALFARKSRLREFMPQLWHSICACKPCSVRSKAETRPAIPSKRFSAFIPILRSASGSIAARHKMKMEMKPMKKLLVSAVLSAMLASPAFAHSYNAGYGTGNLINLPALEHDGPSASAGEAYASAPPRASARHLRHARTQETTSPNDPYAVYDESGQYVGRDPDPNVRFELRRDDAHDY